VGHVLDDDERSLRGGEAVKQMPRRAGNDGKKTWRRLR
jgi:hypothetical protein